MFIYDSRVLHQLLESAFVGSNPTAPAKKLHVTSESNDVATHRLHFGYTKTNLSS